MRFRSEFNNSAERFKLPTIRFKLVSSANKDILEEILTTMSFIYIRNNSGP